MKRKATAQLTREGGYEPVAPVPLPPDCSPEDIQKRKIYRARRPLRQPQFSDDKIGFALKDSLLSAEDEKRLLTDQPPVAVDFLSIPAPVNPSKPSSETPKPAKTVSSAPTTVQTPAKEPVRLFATPLTSPAFKSAGFKSLIEELSRKQTEEVAQAFIQTKTEPTVSPRVVLPDAVTTKTVYKSLLTVRYTQQECKFATAESDKGPGKLEVLQQSGTTEQTYTLVFRNGIGSIMYRAFLPPQPRLVPAKSNIIEVAEEESYAELELLCVRAGSKVALEKCHVAVPVAQKEDFMSRFQRAVAPSK